MGGVSVGGVGPDSHLQPPPDFLQVRSPEQLPPHVGADSPHGVTHDAGLEAQPERSGSL